MTKILILNKAVYIGLALGLFIGGIITQFLPSSHKELSVFIELQDDTDFPFLVQQDSFLFNAEKHSCAPHLKRSLSQKNSRNLRIYIHGTQTDQSRNVFAILKILGKSQKNIECYLKAIMTEYNIHLEKKQLRIKEKIKEIKKTISETTREIEGKKDIIIINQNPSILYDLVSMLQHSTTTYYSTELTEHTPTKIRALIILTSGMIGLAFGIIISALRKKNKSS